MGADTIRGMSVLPRSGSFSRVVVRRSLRGVGIFSAISAVGGGVGLLLPGSMGVPLSMIEDTGLTSFLWPALVLIVVIGGTQVLAVAADLAGHRLALFGAGCAGWALVIWIFMELAFMGEFIALHGIFFGAGVVQIVLVMLLLDIFPGIVGSGRGVRT